MMIRVRIVGEGGGLEQWQDFVEGPEDTRGVLYDIAIASLRDYRDDVRKDPDVIDPRSLVIVIEPVPMP